MRKTRYHKDNVSIAYDIQNKDVLSMMLCRKETAMMYMWGGVTNIIISPKQVRNIKRRVLKYRKGTPYLNLKVGRLLNLSRR